MDAQDAQDNQREVADEKLTPAMLRMLKNKS